MKKKLLFLGLFAFIGLSGFAQVTITVSGEGTEWGETKDKLIDGDLNTKWGSPEKAVWIQFEYTEAQTWNGYSLTSGNDNPTRDFKDWTLQGSNDAVNWDTLDIQEGHAPWAERNSTLDFAFINSTAYLYYKIDVTANNGDESYTQLSELVFSNEVPTAPDAATGLMATAISFSQIEVKWEATEKATGYTVWRKTGAAGTWVKVKEIEDGAVVTFNDTVVEPATEYIYKVVAWNNVGDAPESAEVSATTPIGVGIANSTAFEFSIYPNPASSSVNLKIADSGTLTIYDLQGKTLVSKSITSLNSLIDISYLHSGLYSVCFISNNKTYMQKLVVK